MSGEVATFVPEILKKKNMEQVSKKTDSATSSVIPDSTVMPMTQIKEAPPSLNDSSQKELEADNARLAYLEKQQAEEADSNSKIAKSLQKEIDALKRKIKDKEEASVQKNMEAAKKKVGEKMDYQLRDGSIISKKPAYIRNNRMINYKRVEEFIKIIKNGEYQAAYPIIVANAKKFKTEHPTIAITDAFGKEIPEDQLDDYVSYLDGQHRGRTLIICMLLNFYPDPIPGVVVKDDIEDVAKFLVSINPTGSWSNSQKAEVLALTASSKYLPLCEAISGLVRKGFNRSTASQILTQDKPLSTRQIDLLLEGKEPKEDIVYNLNNGQLFIEKCTNAKIPVKYLTKRYFIEGFLAFKQAHDMTFADAVNVIERLPELNEAELKKVTGKDIFKQMLNDAIAKE